MTPGPARDSWETALQRWADAGLVDDRLVASVRAYETRRITAEVAGAADATTARPSRVPVATEVVGYIGAALAAAAATLIVSNYWRDLESWARLAVVAMVTAVAGATASAVSESEDPAITRLANGLWLLACLGGAWWLGLLGSDPLDWSEESTVLILGAALAGPTLALLAWRRSVLQHLASYVALVAVVAGLCGQYDFADSLTYGLPLWGLGTCWALLTWGRFVPREAAGYALGSITALVAAAMVAGVYEGQGIWLGIATACLALGAAIPTRSRALLATGTLGLFGFTAAVIGHYFGGDDGSGDPGNLGVVAVLLVAGVALLVAAVLSARRHDRTPDRNPEEAPRAS